MGVGGISKTVEHSFSSAGGALSSLARARKKPAADLSSINGRRRSFVGGRESVFRVDAFLLSAGGTSSSSSHGSKCFFHERPVNKKIITENLVEYFEAYPEAYLKEVSEKFTCCSSSMLKRLCKLGITQKKSRRPGKHSYLPLNMTKNLLSSPHGLKQRLKTSSNRICRKRAHIGSSRGGIQSAYRDSLCMA